MSREGIMPLLDHSEIKALCMRIGSDASLNDDIENLIIKYKYMIQKECQT